MSASKFQKALTELRGKIALQGAETTARLKHIETEMAAALKVGFEQFELALVAQTEQNLKNLDSLLEQQSPSPPNAPAA